MDDDVIRDNVVMSKASSPLSSGSSPDTVDGQNPSKNCITPPMSLSHTAAIKTGI